MSHREVILEAELRLLRRISRARCHRLNNLMTEISGHVALMKGATAEEAETRLESITATWRNAADEVARLHASVRVAENPEPYPIAQIRDELVSLMDAGDGGAGGLEVAEDPAWGEFATGRLQTPLLVLFLVMETLSGVVSGTRIRAHKGDGGPEIHLNARFQGVDTADDAVLEAARELAASDDLSLLTEMGDGEFSARLCL